MTLTRPIPATTIPAIGEASFADAIAAILASEELDALRKRHWPTSLRQMAAYLDRPLELIPARMAAVAAWIGKLHAERLGVNAKTFANHRANVRACLLWFNRQVAGNGRNAPMDEDYRTLLAKLEDLHVRDCLSPFFRYLSTLGVPPGAVSDALVEAYVAHRRDTGFSIYRTTQLRAMVREWNKAAGEIPGWPRIALSEPEYAARTRGPAWEAFPKGLRDGIEAHCARLAKRHRGYRRLRVKGCEPSSIATRRRELIAAVRKAVQVGVPLDELQSLSDLVKPDIVEQVLDAYWGESERPSSYVITLASKFLTIARCDTELPEEEVAQLAEIRSELEPYRSTGLTEKNRTLVRQILQPGIWRDVLDLPSRLMAQARADRRTAPEKAAITAQMAVAIRILTFAPVRMQNLASIVIGQNLVRPGRPGTGFLLTFPDHDVKNHVPLEFPLDEETTRLIDTYIHDHRPYLMRGRNHDCLFPGEDHDQKGSQTLGEQITQRLWKAIGLKVTPHQFRHAAAAIVLRKHPGNYELVRRILGHRNLATTTAFYIGLESVEATRQFGEILREDEGRLRSPTRAKGKGGRL